MDTSGSGYMARYSFATAEVRVMEIVTTEVEAEVRTEITVVRELRVVNEGIHPATPTPKIYRGISDVISPNTKEVGQDNWRSQGYSWV